MSLIVTFALLSGQDVPLAIPATDKRYAEAAATVRGWIAKHDTKAKGAPTRLLICDWRPGHRLVLVEGVREGNMGDYPTRSIYHEDRTGEPMRTSYSPINGSATLPSDQPFVDNAQKLCAPLMAQ